MRKLSDREVLILELIFCGLPLVYYLLRLPFMPETVPVHWNASGEADRFAGRFSFDTVLIGAIGYFGLLFGIGLRKMICSVSKSESEQNAQTVERIMKWTQAFMCLLFTGMAFNFVYSSGAGSTQDSGFLLKLGAAVIALTFIAAGNQFPKLRRNSLSGARTKYSLSSDEAWHKTQRYAGRVMLITGAVLLLVILIPVVSATAAAVAALAAMIVICVAIASYRGGK